MPFMRDEDVDKPHREDAHVNGPDDEMLPVQLRSCP